MKTLGPPQLGPICVHTCAKYYNHWPRTMFVFFLRSFFTTAEQGRGSCRPVVPANITCRSSVGSSGRVMGSSNSEQACGRSAANDASTVQHQLKACLIFLTFCLIPAAHLKAPAAEHKSAGWCALRLTRARISTSRTTIPLGSRRFSRSRSTAWFKAKRIVVSTAMSAPCQSRKSLATT